MQANANAPAATAAARRADGEPLTPLELGAWRGLLRVHASLIGEMDEEMRERHGISLSAYEVLMLVGDAPRRRCGCRSCRRRPCSR